MPTAGPACGPEDGAGTGPEPRRPDLRARDLTTAPVGPSSSGAPGSGVATRPRFEPRFTGPWRLRPSPCCAQGLDDPRDVLPALASACTAGSRLSLFLVSAAAEVPRGASGPSVLAGRVSFPSRPPPGPALQSEGRDLLCSGCTSARPRADEFRKVREVLSPLPPVLSELKGRRPEGKGARAWDRDGRGRAAAPCLFLLQRPGWGGLSSGEAGDGRQQQALFPLRAECRVVRARGGGHEETDPRRAAWECAPGAGCEPS